MPETISRNGMCQCGGECDLKLGSEPNEHGFKAYTMWICGRCRTRRIVVLKPSVLAALDEARKHAGPYGMDDYRATRGIARAIRQNPDAMLDTTNPQPMNPSQFMASQIENAAASMGVQASMLGQTRPSTASEIQAMQQQAFSQTPEQVAAAISALTGYPVRNKTTTVKRKERPKNDSITGRKFDLE